MSLLSPTVGELVDRLIIVRLKFEATDDEQDELKLAVEMAALESALLSRTGPCAWDDDPQFKELENVHAALWNVEDEIRSVDPLAMSKIAEMCKRQSKLNDHRAKLVREISERFGEHVAKKVYK